jgi:hypothetical protein
MSPDQNDYQCQKNFYDQLAKIPTIDLSGYGPRSKSSSVFSSTQTGGSEDLRSFRRAPSGHGRDLIGGCGEQAALLALYQFPLSPSPS